MRTFPPGVAKVAFKMADFEVDVKLSSSASGRTGMFSKMALRKSCLPKMYMHGFSNDARYLK